jgi:uncharacterized membrane protein
MGVVLPLPFSFTFNAEVFAYVRVLPYVLIEAECFLVFRAIVADFEPVTIAVDAIIGNRSAVAWFVFSA